MVSTEYVHVVSQEELQRLLNVSDRELDKLRRKDMPATTEPPEGQSGQWWSIAEIRRWIAASNIRTPRQMTLNWWPDTTAPADYLGAEPVYRYSSDPEPTAVLQRWDTDSGEVVVAWQTTDRSVNGKDLARWAPNAAAYVRVDTGWGLRGPKLSAWPAPDAGDGKASISWGHLAGALGRRAPFWAERLRVPELIQSWRPGDPPVRHPGRIGLDIQPLMRMALLYPVDHVAHRALVNTAQVITNREGAHRDVDLKILAKFRAERPFHQGGEDQLEIAAIPPDVDAEALPYDTDPAIARVGWREIAYRTDRLAEQCMGILARWDGGKNLPWAYTITIPRTPSGQEFLNRLEPAQERTAIYAMLDRDRRGRPMVDPLTDTPVILPTDDGNEIRALAPQRLPATTPLAEVILEDTIWVRTADGTLYPRTQRLLRRPVPWLLRQRPVDTGRAHRRPTHRHHRQGRRHQRRCPRRPDQPDAAGLALGHRAVAGTARGRPRRLIVCCGERGAELPTRTARLERIEHHRSHDAARGRRAQRRYGRQRRLEAQEEAD